jgi:hypothetical protein
MQRTGRGALLEFAQVVSLFVRPAQLHLSRSHYLGRRNVYLLIAPVCISLFLRASLSVSAAMGSGFSSSFYAPPERLLRRAFYASACMGNREEMGVLWLRAALALIKFLILTLPAFYIYHLRAVRLANKLQKCTRRAADAQTDKQTRPEQPLRLSHYKGK